MYTFSECQTPFKVSRECVSTSFSINMRVYENGSKKEQQMRSLAGYFFHSVSHCCSVLCFHRMSKFIRSKCASRLLCGKRRRYKSYKYIIIFHSIVARSQCETDNSVFITHATMAFGTRIQLIPIAIIPRLTLKMKDTKKRTNKKIKWRQHCRPAMYRRCDKSKLNQFPFLHVSMSIASDSERTYRCCRQRYSNRLCVDNDGGDDDDRRLPMNSEM